MSEGQSSGKVGDERSGTDKNKLLLGRVAAVLGILVSLPIVLIPNATAFLTLTAIVLGGGGYALGARRLGVATIIIAGVALILGLMALRGYILTI